jgi:hypothetical protein
MALDDFLRLIKSQYEKKLIGDFRYEDEFSKALEILNKFEAMSSSVGFNSFGREFQFAAATSYPDTNNGLENKLTRDLSRRVSTRKFEDKPILLKEMNRFLASALGGSISSKRAYPSAGAVYPVEIFALDLHAAKNQQKSPLYLFEHQSKILISIPNSDFGLDAADLILDAPTNEDIFSNQVGHFYSPAWIFLFIIDKRRAVERYLSRGVIFAIIEVGAICQLIADHAASEGFATCLFGATPEKLTMRKLGLNSSRYFSAITMVMGYPGQ